jgi:hypothetical protein
MPAAATPSSASKKRLTTPQSKKSTSGKRKAASASKRRTIDTSKRPTIDTRKPAPAAPLTIHPKFAMMARALYSTPAQVLSIPDTDEHWTFDLGKHLTKVLAENPGLTSIYCIGSRNEERPVLKDINATKQVDVPYFSVHALPHNAKQPSSIIIYDLENKTECVFEMTELSLKWEEVASLPTGQKVHMLDCTMRTTSSALRALSPTESSALTGGQLWFPISADSKANPGEKFTYSRMLENGESDNFFFHYDDMWKPTIRALLKLETEKGTIFTSESKSEQWAVLWKKLCDLDEAAWLAVLLPVAVDQFFTYQDHLPRAECEREVTQLLATTFKAFKTQLETDMLAYEEHHYEETRHFKIYPENPVLQEYLSNGCSHLSKWCGKATAVYPPVQPSESVGGNHWLSSLLH